MASIVANEMVAHATEPELCKPKSDFRNYEDSARQSVVENHYRMMRTNQTVEFVKRMNKKYSFKEPRARMTVREAMKTLESYVDSSDPDVSLPNAIHMFQAAEGCRKQGMPDWMQLVGLIHDMGKMMFLWGTPEDGQQGTGDGAQWAPGGDTWGVSCALPECAVFPHFNALNPDQADPRYNTSTGIYTPGCGMHNLMYAYGHDEYMYQMCIANNTTIPREGLACIRFHSCYPWHTGGAYEALMAGDDGELREWVRDFNKHDLYTKDEKGLTKAEVDALWPYYEGLIAKYFPTDLLMW
jgi:inositol oxygenase